MIPKTGNVFPGGGGRGGSNIGYAEAIALALRKELGDTHQAAKIAMRWTGANERTAKNWLCGRSGPSGRHLVSLARHSDAVLEVFLHLAHRDQVVAGIRLVDARDRLKDMLELANILLGDLERQ